MKTLQQKEKVMRYLVPLAILCFVGCGSSDFTLVGVGDEVVSTPEAEESTPTAETVIPEITPEIVDNDGDGWTVEGGDCNDGDKAINPGAIEVCDGIDNNCDGNTDGDAGDRVTIYFDGDGDGYAFDYESATSSYCPTEEMPSGYFLTADDCDDSNPEVHPGAEEVCDWVVDNNCDGVPFVTVRFWGPGCQEFLAKGGGL